MVNGDLHLVIIVADRGEYVSRPCIDKRAKWVQKNTNAMKYANNIDILHVSFLTEFNIYGSCWKLCPSERQENALKIMRSLDFDHFRLC